MRWFVVIHRHPVDVEYADVPESQLMGLIRGWVEDPRVHGFEATPNTAARPAAPSPPRPYPMAA